MGYINGLRSFGYRSELVAKRSRTKKRESTGMDALARAERAHWLCRKAAELARERKIKEAEECATRGIDELKERSVSKFS
jgi:phage terminase Nu1 subunit (DNA packaging protein)